MLDVPQPEWTGALPYAISFPSQASLLISIMRRHAHIRFSHHTQLIDEKRKAFEILTQVRLASNLERSVHPLLSKRKLRKVQV
jgi:hypothetical protein